MSHPVFPHMGWSCVGCRRAFAGSQQQWGCPYEPHEVEMQRTATLSPCGTFRYRLTREWAGGPTLVFVMLNPSTADALADDPTVRKCIGFAQRNGFGSITVVNLFAYRATDPGNLKAAGWQVGPENDEHIIEAVTTPGCSIVFAWGAHARGDRGRARVAQVLDLVATWAGVQSLALKLADDGTPHHPLMLPYASALTPYPAGG